MHTHCHLPVASTVQGLIGLLGRRYLKAGLQSPTSVSNMGKCRISAACATAVNKSTMLAYEMSIVQFALKGATGSAVDNGPY
ncbi:hypothethical protein (plasmid) [Ralstonia solanacearum PSI07]|nr:hypothethical protein [Ralstonia solanacearum PSI07]